MEFDADKFDLDNQDIMEIIEEDEDDFYDQITDILTETKEPFKYIGLSQELFGFSCLPLAENDQLTDYDLIFDARDKSLIDECIDHCEREHQTDALNRLKEIRKANSQKDAPAV